MAQIIARRTAAGEARYDVRIRIGDRVVTRTFRRRRDADSYAKTVEADRLRGVAVDPRGQALPFARLAEEWLASNPSKRPSTLARDEAIVRHHLTPTLGSRTLGSLAPRDIQALVSTWAETYAPATVQRHYTCLQAICSAAVAADYIARSPCRGIKLPRSDGPAGRAVTPEEVVTLAEGMEPADATMTYVGAVLGLRWGECAGLRVRNLDFAGRTLEVAEQRTRGLKGAMVTGPPKSRAGVRTLSVPSALMELLADHLARRGLTAGDPDAYVFTTPAGTPLHYSNWRSRVWLPGCRAAGLPGLRFHDLRGAAATTLVAEGVDVKTAQTRLGHASPMVTLALYARATTLAHRAAADRLGNRFFPGPRDGRAMEEPDLQETAPAQGL